MFFTLIHDDPEVNKERGRNNFPVPIDLQIINCTRIEGKIRVRRTLGGTLSRILTDNAVQLFIVKVYNQGPRIRTVESLRM
jgi:hypothetical protein